MKPILFWLGDVPVGSWPVFFALACAAGMLLCCYLLQLGVPQTVNSQASASDPGHASNARALWSSFRPASFLASLYLCGLVGARVGGGLESPEGGFALLGPMSFFGGLVGGTLGAVPFVWGSHSRRLPLLLDAALPACVLGLAIGRLGCLLNGDDYGLPAGHAGPFVFGHGLMPVMFGAGPGSVLRYATQLEESVFCFILALLCVTLAHVRAAGERGGKRLLPGAVLRCLGPGQMGLAAAVLLCAHRFWNEGFREGPRLLVAGQVVGVWQLVALVLAVSFAALWFLAMGGQRKTT